MTSPEDPARTQFDEAVRIRLNDELSAAALGTFSAADYGADPAASWTVNRDAFQAANDAAVAAGGGRVSAPPGVYLAKGIVLDSRVVLDIPGVTIQSPDGLAPNVITTRLSSRTASAVKGSRDVTVTLGGVAGIEIGARVAIFAAGGLLDSQQSRLSGAVDATSTDLTLINVTGLAAAGTLIIDDELITFTGRTAGALTGVSRGAFGTTPAAHTATAPIGVARRLYATIVGISGDVIALDRPAQATATGVALTFGTVRSGIIGFPTIDGNKPVNGAPASVYAVLVQLSAWGEYDLRIVNGETGGMMFSRGSAYNLGRRIHLHDSSVPAAFKGSAFWLYQGCEQNHFEDITVTGHSWVGVYLDDRTSINEEGWDAPNSHNTFVTINIDVTQSATGVLNVVSGRYNRFLGGRLKSPKIGINCSNNSQGSSAGQGSVGNEFTSFTLNVGETPYTLSASGNLLHDCFVEASHQSYPGTAALGNTVYAVSPAPGVAPLMAAAYRLNMLPKSRLDTWDGWTILPAAGTGGPNGVIDLLDTATTFNPIVYNTTPIAVGPGVPLAASVEVTVPAGYPAVTLAAVVLGYRNVSSTPSVTNSVVGPITTINPGETKRLTAAIPVTAALTEGARVQIQLRSAAATGRRIVVSPSPVLEKNTTQPGQGFNGDTAGALWVGEPGNSTSVLFA
ncbi:hypothetical protein DC434_06965 [Microbacterium sp. TPD7012]|nr:hypothetical protein DC434_06965 [Microbacterium sp. TPD7012]